jgi:hypothetical protein
MNHAVSRASGRGLVSLRRLAYERTPTERCDLCAGVIPQDHEHLVDPTGRRLLCTCAACAILFDDSGVTRYRRVPRDIRQPEGLHISDEFWNGLAIPIGLVFFFRSSVSGHMMALYPSPAGPTETTLDEDACAELTALHPSIGAMKSDTEALIVNHINNVREYYIAPIDECYKLTGIIRRGWRGFSGGEEVWQDLRIFFDDLKRRSRPDRVASHA